MIGAWLGALPALVIAVAVLFGPGLAIGAALRLRGLALWALAPVVSVAVVAGLALVYGFVRVPWAAWSILAGVAVVVGLAWLARLLLGPRPALPVRDARGTWLVTAGLLVGGLLTAARFIVYVHDPAAISKRLVEALRDPDPEVRQNLAVALAKIGPPAIEYLIGALKDPLPERRAGSAYALGLIGPPVASRALMDSERRRSLSVIPSGSKIRSRNHRSRRSPLTSSTSWPSVAKPWFPYRNIVPGSATRRSSPP